MEHFAQTNVFAQISTVFAHLIIGCAIRYPKTGNLRYFVSKIQLMERHQRIGHYAYHSLKSSETLSSYSTALRQYRTHSFSIDRISFQVDRTTNSSLHGSKHSHSPCSMFVPFRHGALKCSNWHKLPQVIQAIQMIECKRVSARTMLSLSGTMCTLSFKKLVIQKSF